MDKLIIYLSFQDPTIEGIEKKINCGQAEELILQVGGVEGGPQYLVYEVVGALGGLFQRTNDTMIM